MLPPRLLATMHTRVLAKVTWKTASSRSSTLFPLAGARYSTSMAPEGWDSPRKCSYTPYSTRFTPRRVPLRFCVCRDTPSHIGWRLVRTWVLSQRVILLFVSAEKKRLSTDLTDDVFFFHFCTLLPLPIFSDLWLLFVSQGRSLDCDASFEITISSICSGGSRFQQRENGTFPRVSENNRIKKILTWLLYYLSSWI